MRPARRTAIGFATSEFHPHAYPGWIWRMVRSSVPGVARSVVAGLCLMTGVSALGQVNLSWTDNSSDEQGFQIERALATTLDFSVHAVVGADITNYTDTAVVPSISYAYRVAAFNAAGRSDYTNTVTSTAPVPVNSPPTVSPLANLTIDEDASTGDIGLMVGDAETAAESLVLSAHSSNFTLVPPANVVFGGSGTNRAVRVTPAANQFGTTTITVTVSDGELSTSVSFVLNVIGRNDPPTITRIADQTIAQGASTDPLVFTIGDVETAAEALTVTSSSSDPELIPSAGIMIDGAGANRTIVVTPNGSRSGTAQIEVSVSDGELSTSVAFQLLVTAVNQAPTITDVADLTLPEGTSTLVAFSIEDVDTPLDSLALSVSSSNPILLPLENLQLGGTGSNRTLSISPAPRESGTGTITLTVSDGVRAASDTFIVTVAPALPPPWIAVDVGRPITAGRASPTENGFSVSGAGVDIGKSSDQFHFVHQSATADCEIVVRLIAMDNTHAEAKAGVMIRESTAAGSRFVGFFATPTGGLRLLQRASTGGTTTSTRVNKVSAPQWLKLTRVESTFVGSYSHDGITWTAIKAARINMAAVVEIGLAVTSCSSSLLCTAEFEHVVATP